MVASLNCWVLAPTAAKLRVANNTGVRAVEENILDVFVLQVGSLQDIF
jgi:hypothetical protein